MIEAQLKRAKKPERRAELEAELHCPPFPMPLAPIWNTFWRLRNRVNGSGFGPGRITWPDIDAFCRHSRRELDPWEVELIEMLDDLYLNPRPDDGRESA